MNKTSFKLIDDYEKIKFEALLTSKDVMDILATMKANDDNAENENSFTGLVISTEHIDRSGEVVKQDGINTDLYMKNPVVLNSHNYYGIENIVGMTTRLYKGVVDGVAATLADGRWAPTPAGEMAKALWDAKCLSAASVGFIPEEFDKSNGSIITKSQLLEYSVVPVPANGWATRQEAFKILESKGITAAGLRAKGFSVKEAEDEDGPKVGDECTMEDGTLGTFSKEGDRLVCLPKENSAKQVKTAPEVGGPEHDPSEESVWPELKSEHAFHEKAVKGHFKELCEAMKCESEKEPEEGAGEEEQKAFRAEIRKSMEAHEKKFKAVMKAEHERHIKAIDEIHKAHKAEHEKPEDEDPEDGEDGKEKMAALFKQEMPFLSDDQLAIVVKTAAAMNDSMHKKLTMLCESFEEGHGEHEEAMDTHKDAIDEFKALIKAHEPTEGNDGRKPPEKRSIPGADQKLNFSAKEIADLARLLNDATREALTTFKGLPASQKRSR